jgi:hypothetical protein
MQVCRICKRELPDSYFCKNKGNKTGLDYRCRYCRKIESREYREKHYFSAYCRTKKSECKRKGIEYNLTPEYLESIWTGVCPIFNVPIERASHGRGSHHSAHLDRLDPNKGYVIGNVSWISGRANRIKYNATVEELRAVVDWMERATTIPKGSTPKQVEKVS